MHSDTEIIMQRPLRLMKSNAMAFSVITIALLTGLGACSTVTQTPPPSSPAVATPNASSSMDHGGMNHSMDHSASMALGPADAEFDLRFIDAMTPHHQGAVVMSQDAQQKSKRPELQKLAKGIIQAQAQEIAQMQQWRQAWYPNAKPEPVAYDAQMGHSMPMSSAQKGGMMMTMDLGKADAQFDLRFINAMIPHHEAAVVMAKDVLTKSQRPEVKKLAQAIVVSQQAEISQMKQWRQAWYKQ